MGQAGVSYLLSQLGFQVPALLVYAIAFVLALVFMGRAQVPSVLTLIGVAILVVATIGGAVLQAWIIDSRQASGLSDGQVGRFMGIVGFIGSCLRAVGLGLLVAAIFAGRRDVKARLPEF
jgi:hypothetical protein